MAADRPTEASWRPELAVLAALALAYALYVGRGNAQPIPIACLALALLLTALAVLGFGRWKPGNWLSPQRVVTFAIAVQLALLAVWPVMNPLAQSGLGDYVPYWVGLAAASGLTVLCLSARSDRLRWGLLLGLSGLHLAISIWVIGVAPDPFIDVWTMQQEGAAALAAGTNPYLPIYENIHGPDTTYYGPGLVVDGQLTIGFPYPPLSLILASPGFLVFGDVRYVHALALAAAGPALAAVRPGRSSAAAAIALLFNPWSFFLVLGAWTEPLVVLSVTAVLLSAARAPGLTGIGLGITIALKQYMLIALPLAVLLLARDNQTRWRWTWQSLAVALVVTVPFALWDLDAFAWSTIGSLAVQVFRADSLSFLAILPDDVGPAVSFVGFIALAIAAVLVAWRAPRTPAGFAASLALLLLSFFAFSRQGSANYHFAVIGALWSAVAVSSLSAARSRPPAPS